MCLQSRGAPAVTCVMPLDVSSDAKQKERSVQIPVEFQRSCVLDAVPSPWRCIYSVAPRSKVTSAPLGGRFFAHVTQAPGTRLKSWFGISSIPRRLQACVYACKQLRSCISSMGLRVAPPAHVFRHRSAGSSGSCSGSTRPQAMAFSGGGWGGSIDAGAANGQARSSSRAAPMARERSCTAFSQRARAAVADAFVRIGHLGRAASSALCRGGLAESPHARFSAEHFRLHAAWPVLSGLLYDCVCQCFGAWPQQVTWVRLDRSAHVPGVALLTSTHVKQMFRGSGSTPLGPRSTASSAPGILWGGTTFGVRGLPVVGTGRHPSMTEDLLLASRYSRSPASLLS